MVQLLRGLEIASEGEGGEEEEERNKKKGPCDFCGSNTVLPDDQIISEE